MVDAREDGAARGGPTAPSLLRALRRYWYAALPLALLGAALGMTYAGSLTATATASASLLVQDPRTLGPYGTGETSANYVATQVALLQLPATIDGAVALLPRGSAAAGPPLDADALASGLSVSSTEGTDLIGVSFADESPQRAKAVVDAVVRAYEAQLQSSTQESTTRQITAVDAQIEQLRAELAKSTEGRRTVLNDSIDALISQRQELTTRAATGPGLSVVSPAVLPEPGSTRSPAQAGIAGAIVGLVPGLGLAYVLASSRRRFTDRFEPETLAGVPLLSEIPLFGSERLSSDMPIVDAPQSSAAEAFRFAGNLLSIRQTDLGSTVHAVVSAASLDGKSTVTANLAVTCAEAGRRVLAIDADVSGRGLSFLLLSGEVDGPGLVDVLDGTLRLAAAVETLRLPSGSSLDVLRAGSRIGDSTQLLASSRWDALVTSIPASYDLVLIDVPPVLQVASAATMVRAVDAAILVVPHQSSVHRTEDLVDRISLFGTPALGYLYNRAPLRAELGQHSRRVTETKRLPRDSSARSQVRVGGPGGRAPEGEPTPPTAQPTAQPTNQPTPQESDELSSSAPVQPEVRIAEPHVVDAIRTAAPPNLMWFTRPTAADIATAAWRQGVRGAAPPGGTPPGVGAGDALAHGEAAKLRKARKTSG